MPKLIKLTSRGGNDLYINPLNIESVLKNSEKDMTEIRVFMREIAYAVKETPEEIINKMEKVNNIINYNVKPQD